MKEISYFEEERAVFCSDLKSLLSYLKEKRGVKEICLIKVGLDERQGF